MQQIKIKRVYDPEDKTDGFRVLVDKLWPRGIKKESFHYDLWAKDIAPSTLLRKWYHEDMEKRWQEFAQRYTKELEDSPAVEAFINQTRTQHTVTLLYASRNAECNHALVLRDFLTKKIERISKQ